MWTLLVPLYLYIRRFSTRVGSERFPVFVVLSLSVALTMIAFSIEPVSAQVRYNQAAITVGSGLQIGNGGGSETISKRSPLFLDFAYRTWIDEDEYVLYGGSIRMELESQASVAGVPRVELRHRVGDFELRPGFALPFYFAPFYMFGAEVSLTVRFALTKAFGILGGLTADAFFLGNEIPDDSVVLMLNGGLGVDLEI